MQAETSNQPRTPRSIDGLGFRFVCEIQPERNSAGAVLEFHPQEAYGKKHLYRLHPHGHGPFCKFKIPRHMSKVGVYALAIDDYVVYVGKCVDLAKRYNMGYGNISPKNCYEGGQRTNCKVNSKVFQEISSGRSVSLWFLETQNKDTVETALIAKLNPPWNGRQ